MNVLLLIDLQRDFCAGGSLAVSDGDAVVPVANRLTPRFGAVVLTQDFHPPEHLSFAVNHPGKRPYETIELDGLPQVLWPSHCVRDTSGADFHPALRVERHFHVVQKGTDPRIDSYSGFYDNGHRKATGLHEHLERIGARHLYVLGLATDYCVKWTVFDALELGYSVTVIEDGCRGVGLAAHDIEESLREMKQRGAQLSSSEQLLASQS